MNTEIDTGFPAPDFALLAYDGQKIRLSDYKGKSHIVLFFVREFN
jgi:peroxiredoxin